MNVDSVTLVILLAIVAALVGAAFVTDRKWARTSEETAEHRTGNALRGQLAELFMVAVWFGLLTASIHLSLAFINRFVRNHFLMVGPQIVWLAPVSYVLFFLGFGSVLAVLSFVSPRLAALQVTATVFAWLGLFALLLPFHQLQQLAAAVLAAGVAVQVGRLMARHPAKWMAVMRAMPAPICGSLAVLAVATTAWRVAAESLDLRQLAPPRTSAPNVLLVVMDTVRAANLSLSGYSRPTTPELEKLAADGAAFDWAFSTAPWTLKSHASMFTGRYPDQIVGDFERPVDGEAPMLAELFRDRGYVTGGFVANLPYTSRESGLARGFVHYDDYRVSPRQAVMHAWPAHTPLFRGLANSRRIGDVLDTLRHPSLDFEPDTFNDRTYERKAAGAVNAAFLEWQTAHRDRPFFAFLNYFDAHIVYQAPPEFAARFRLPGRGNVGRYDAAIAYIDHEIGVMLDELRRRGVLDNTIVIITSDHGEQFGEHGLRLHGNSLYLPLLHVPLVIRYPPRVPQGTRVNSPVSLRDLAATVLDLAAVTPAARAPGFSLASQWERTATGRGSPIMAELDGVIRPTPDWPAFFGPMRSVIDSRFHYIRRGDGVEELYKYREDSAEARDISKEPEGQMELSRLRALADAPEK